METAAHPPAQLLCAASETCEDQWSKQEGFARILAVGVALLAQGAPSNPNRMFKPLFTTTLLSICRSIMENHNGRIWSTGDSERGSILQFAVPVKCQS
jgi:hypothetical protein